mmetsp:Transcript_27334/g.58044  ORF Transcript_27334/g.58044 Transcript_27334/m.58044 type:complete len:677 (-) Transcript_27334:79-2109(-)
MHGTFVNLDFQVENRCPVANTLANRSGGRTTALQHFGPGGNWSWTDAAIVAATFDADSILHFIEVGEDVLQVRPGVRGRRRVVLVFFDGSHQLLTCCVVQARVILDHREIHVREAFFREQRDVLLQHVLLHVLDVILDEPVARFRRRDESQLLQQRAARRRVDDECEEGYPAHHAKEHGSLLPKFHVVGEVVHFGVEGEGECDAHRAAQSSIAHEHRLPPALPYSQTGRQGVEREHQRESNDQYQKKEREEVAVILSLEEGLPLVGLPDDVPPHAPAEGEEEGVQQVFSDLPKVVGEVSVVVQCLPERLYSDAAEQHGDNAGASGEYFRGEEDEVCGRYRRDDLNDRILPGQSVVEIIQHDQKAHPEGHADASASEAELEEELEPLAPADFVPLALHAELVQEPKAEDVVEDHGRSVVHEALTRHVHLEPGRRAELVQQHRHGDRVRRGEYAPERHAQVEAPPVREDVIRHQRRQRRPRQHHGKGEDDELPEARQEEVDVDVVRVQVQQPREEDEQYHLPLDVEPRPGREGDGIQLLPLDEESDRRADHEHERRVRDGVGVSRYEVVREDADDLREPREEEGVHLPLLLGEHLRLGLAVMVVLFGVMVVVFAVSRRVGSNGARVIAGQDDAYQNQVGVGPNEAVAKSLRDAPSAGPGGLGGRTTILLPVPSIHIER